MFNENWKEELENLFPNWDGNYADVPSQESISCAETIINCLNPIKNNIECIVKADPAGGVDFFIKRLNGSTASIYLLNSSRSFCTVNYEDGHAWYIEIKAADDQFFLFKMLGFNLAN